MRIKQLEILNATKDLMKKTLLIDTNAGILEFHWLSEVLRFDKNADARLKLKYPNQEDYKIYQWVKKSNFIRIFTYSPAPLPAPPPRVPRHKAPPGAQNAGRFCVLGCQSALRPRAPGWQRPDSLNTRNTCTAMRP